MTGKINIKVWMTILVLSVFLIGFVSAFGVSSDYWVGNPLKISPGETKTISLRLQNIIGAEDIKVKAILKDGQGIATTESKDYLVKAGTKDTEVPITVSIPSNIPLGKDKTSVETSTFLCSLFNIFISLEFTKFKETSIVLKL